MIGQQEQTFLQRSNCHYQQDQRVQHPHNAMYFRLFCRLQKKLKQQKRQTRQKAQKQRKRLRNQKKMVKTQMRMLQQKRQKAQVKEIFVLSWKGRNS